MTASSEGTTYARIEYWVAKATARPIKGKFYSDSGRLLKTAYYRRYQDIMGGQRPTETLIIDGIDTQLVTRMLYS
ncbi:outer membrane lipoprotein-sorting protein, partial [Acinetobacter baumannii]